MTLTVGGAALLALASASVQMMGIRWSRLHVKHESFELFRAVANVVLDGSLPTEPARRATALDAHLARLRSLFSGLPPHTLEELDQLVGLLNTATGRLILTGMSRPWPQSPLADVAAALNVMRFSAWDLRQQVYHALRDLTQAAYYSDPSTWSRLNYPGPTPLQAAQASS